MLGRILVPTDEKRRNIGDNYIICVLYSVRIVWV